MKKGNMKTVVIQQTLDINTMLFQSWTTVFDAVPLFKLLCVKGQSGVWCKLDVIHMNSELLSQFYDHVNFYKYCITEIRDSIWLISDYFKIYFLKRNGLDVTAERTA